MHDLYLGEIGPTAGPDSDGIDWGRVNQTPLTAALSNAMSAPNVYAYRKNVSATGVQFLPIADPMTTHTPFGTAAEMSAGDEYLLACDNPVERFYFQVGNSYKVVDGDGKVLFSMERDVTGITHLQAVDANGSKRRVLTPQAGTVKMDTTATILDVTFDEPFTEHPVVTLTPSKPLPNHDMKVTKTGIQIDFASAPDATVGWDAKQLKGKA